MVEVKKISVENIEELRNLYNEFLPKAQEDYFFELQPLPFDDFKANFENGYIKGYLAFDNEKKAFLLYSDTLNQAIEITLIYTQEDENSYKIKLELLKKFISDMKNQYKNKIISYPMLGIQNYFTQDITSVGFNLVGEMIIELDFHSSLSEIILEKINLPKVDGDIKFECWNDVYLNDASNIICDEFSKLNDAKFDPRFLNIESTKQILIEITKGYYGEFNPKYTTVITKGGKVIGVCFLNFTTPQVANIPLIALCQNSKNKGLGKVLLYNSIKKLQQDIKSRQCTSRILNATCDTDNFPACKMYRALGFKEKTYYTHAYLEI